jgi:hypothetical protein
VPAWATGRLPVLGGSRCASLGSLGGGHAGGIGQGWRGSRLSSSGGGGIVRAGLRRLDIRRGGLAREGLTPTGDRLGQIRVRYASFWRGIRLFGDVLFGRFFLGLNVHLVVDDSRVN